MKSEWGQLYKLMGQAQMNVSLLTKRFKSWMQEKRGSIIKVSSLALFGPNHKYLYWAFINWKIFLLSEYERLRQQALESNNNWVYDMRMFRPLSVDISSSLVFEKIIEIFNDSPIKLLDSMQDKEKVFEFKKWSKLTLNVVSSYLQFPRVIQAVRVVNDTKDAIVRLLCAFEYVWYPIFTPQHGNYQFEDGKIGRLKGSHLYLRDMSINHGTYESLFQYTNYHNAHQQHKSVVNEFCLSTLTAINLVSTASFVLLVNAMKNVTVMMLRIIEDTTLDRLEASNKFVIYLDGVMMDDGLVPLQVEKGNNMPHKLRKVEIVWSGQMFETSLSNSQQWDQGASISRCNDNCSKRIITRWRGEDVQEASVEGDIGVWKKSKLCTLLQHDGLASIMFYVATRLKRLERIQFSYASSC
jgi:hypothetical protein